MSEWDNEFRRFLTYWVSGFLDGLAKTDERARETILGECGKACARSYTAQVFQDARRQSTDMDAFFVYLADRFPGATYERTDARTMRVRYATCECDLVRHRLVTSPMLCACSAHNLRENLEQSLGVPVSVAIESSILRGGTHCLLVASFQGDVQV
jgi:hypothetical protein